MDLLDDLQKVIDIQGVTDGSFEGNGINLALRELQAQRGILSKLSRDLKLTVSVEPIWAVSQAPRTKIVVHRNPFVASSFHS